MPEGKLAVLFAGFGGLSTTFMAKCLLARKGGALHPAFASLLLDPPEVAAVTPLRDSLRLAPVADVVFGGWDVFLEDAAARAEFAEILPGTELDSVLPELGSVEPMRAVFYRDYPVGVFGTFDKRLPTKAAMVQALAEDITTFLDTHGAQRAVAVWCGSPERVPAPAVHKTILSFTRGLETNDSSIPNSQIYSWASVTAGTPFLSVEPNGCVSFPAIRQFARELGVPLAGEGFPTLPPPVDPGDATEADRISRRQAIASTIPLLLDTILLLDRARQSGWADLQEWLGIYFAAPGPDLPRRKEHFLEALSRLAANQPLPLA